MKIELNHKTQPLLDAETIALMEKVIIDSIKNGGSVARQLESAYGLKRVAAK